MTEPAPRLTRSRLALTAASCVLALALLAVLMPRATGVGWDAVLAALRAAPPLSLALLVLLAFGALGASATGTAGAIRGLGLRRALPASAAATAVSVAVPGGATIAAGLLYAVSRRAGVSRADTIAGLVAVTVAEAAVGLLLVPVGALCLLLGAPGLLGPGAAAALIALGLLCPAVLAAGALVLRPAPLRRLLEGAREGLEGLGLGRVVEGRVDIDDVLDVRERVASRLRTHGAIVLGAPLAIRLLQLGALLVALHAVGVVVPSAQAVGVLVLGRLLALVPITPGGAGLAEAGSAALLVALGAERAASGAASVLVSVMTLLVPVVLGVLAAPAVLRRR